MNKFVMIGAALIVAIGAWLAAAYMGQGEEVALAQNETALEHAEKHLDPKYVCPMHPQIVRDEEGSCPICGMDLVEKKVEPKKQETALEHAQKHLDPKYVCPMHPQIVRDEEGSCPICGMDLVLKEVEQSTGPEVTISPAVINNMGVRTAKVERGRLWRRIDTVAAVDYDQSRVSHIHLRTDGWIEQLAVRSEGERVKKGERLFNVYSPALVNAMEEYLQALSGNNRRLITASRDRLTSLGISSDQIARLQSTRKVPQTVPIYAPQNGVVSMLNVREGMYVMPAFEVMRLADLSKVWILADVFEAQTDWVALDQPADVTLSYLPGKLWEGKVEYIYPSLDPKTRTLRVRLKFDNPDEALKPNMYAQVTIYGGPKNDVINIPREALIRTGEQQRVIVATGDGRFVPKQVTAGMESGDWVEIVDGLEEGESVVTSGQFLIDSEASLKASLMRMQE
jgi:Cu(I)/Ag(I) efflux system membrane fusion protein